MSIVGCMGSWMESASRYTGDILVGLDRLEAQTGAEHYAKGWRSALAGRELNTACQTSANNSSRH